MEEEFTITWSNTSSDHPTGHNNSNTAAAEYANGHHFEESGQYEASAAAINNSKQGMTNRESDPVDAGSNDYSNQISHLKTADINQAGNTDLHTPVHYDDDTEDYGETVSDAQRYDTNVEQAAVGSGDVPVSADPEEVATFTSFPRLHKLRMDNGIKTEIACQMSKLHHITKDHKGFFRVRICRTCSGLPHLLELGSYSDLESATLVNDVHEYLNHRMRHLHVITEDDIKFIDQITVVRTWRHERSEVKLLDLLQVC